LFFFVVVAVLSDGTAGQHDSLKEFGHLC